MFSRKAKANLAFVLSLALTLTPISTFAEGRGNDNSEKGTIKGTVLRKGLDSEESQIVHNPYKFLYSGMDVNVRASIKDNISVMKAEIWAKNEESSEWTVIPMNRESGDFKDGTYLGVLPWMVLNGSKVQYQIKSQDFGGNVTSTPLYDVELKFGVKPDEYETDFTNPPEGWRIEGDWQWGVPEGWPTPVSGDKLIGTNLKGAYADNSESVMVLPPLDLRDSQEASVRLKHCSDMDKRDELTAAVSNDFGKTWTNVYEYTGKFGEKPEYKHWEDMIIQLDEYCGSDNPVLISFKLKNEYSSYNHLGWYLDTIKYIGEDNEAPSAPSELKVEAGAKSINLSWTGVDEVDLKGYSVYRALEGEELQRIAQTEETTFVDTNYVPGSKYKYIVKAYDLSDNESESSKVVSVKASVMEVIHTNDFEENIVGWLTGGTHNSWEWGKPTQWKGPSEVPSGEKVWGTDLIREYAPDSNCGIVSPEIDLTEFTEAELEYKQWLWTETNSDFAHVEISKDHGQTWEEIAKYDGEHKEWKEQHLSLKSYVGNKIKIRFLLTSDYMSNRPGWFIDDFTILAGKDSEESSTATKAAKINESKVIKSEKVKDNDKVIIEEHVFVDGDEVIKLQNEPSSYDFTIADENEEDSMEGVPVEAVISIVETGESVNADLSDGNFELKHSPSTEGKPWTLKVEAYGFYDIEEKIELAKGQEIIKNYLLEDFPKGIITGKLVDERTKEPIKGVKIKVVEDEMIPTAVTDTEGNFTINDVLEGQYTLRISDEKYHMKEMDIDIVGGEEKNMSINMKPFIGFKSEIAYDDGTYDEARVVDGSGAAWAVKMTPENLSVLNGVEFYVDGEDWPNPGNNQVQVIVLNATKDEKGRDSGEEVFKTDILEIKRGDWNYVDLSGYKFSTDKDFYLGIVQIGSYPNCIGMGMDETGSFANRSYQYFPEEEEVQFRKLGYEFGNIMIHADVSYLLETPTLEYVEKEDYTNKDSITLSGTTTMDSTVKVFVNDKEVKTVKTDKKTYKVEVPLIEGENNITVSGLIEEGETDRSEAIKVIKDTIKPEIKILSPTNGGITGKEVVTVSGKVTDINLKTVKVNNKEVDFKEDGSFSKRVIVEEGDNTISLTAVDQAGNTTQEIIKVNVNLSVPTITDMKPTSDTAVKAGEEVKLSFKSNAQGGKAYFRVIASNAVTADNENNGRVKMEEVEPGLYEGIWQAPQNFVVQDGLVEFEITDDLGNKNSSYVEGRIYTVSDEIDIDSKYTINITSLNVKRNEGRVEVEAVMKNVKLELQNPILVIKVTDENNKNINISTVKTPNLIGGKSVKLISGFNTPEKGKYTIEAFVVNSLEENTPISNVEKATLDI